MASQPDVLQFCLQAAAKSAKSALERCIASAVAALQLAETQTMKLAHRDELAAAWRELLKNKTPWSQQYPIELQARFKDLVAAAETARKTPAPSAAQSALAAPASAPYATSKLATLTPDMFTLVDDAEVAQAIESARLLQQVLPVVEHSLAELNTLVSSVQGLTNVKPELNPLRPDVFTEVLQAMTSSAALPPAVSALCVKHLAGPLAQELNTIYQQAVQQLESAHVQSVTYRVLQTPAGVAGGASSRSGGAVKNEGGSSTGSGSGSGFVPYVGSGPGQTAAGSAQTPAPLQYADLSNYEIRDDLFQDFLLHGGSQADQALAPSYYATVNKELASLQQEPDPAFGQPKEAIVMAPSRYASLPAVDRPQRPVGERSELDGEVWGAYSLPRQRALLRTQLKQEASRVGQVLGLEVVRQLVNQVAQDPRLLTPVREAVVALEPSLLRLAMVDPRFFSDETHAGRRLMERVAQRSFKFNDEFSPEFLAFIGPVTVAFKALNTQPIENAQPFGATLASLESDWDAQDQQELASRAKVLTALSFAEDRQTQADQISFDMSNRPDLDKVPGIVLDFLFGPWALVLAHAKLTDTRQQLDPQGFGSVVSDLLWSTKSEVTIKQPAKLIEMIPGLLGKLHDGLHLLGQDPRENEAFFENLMNLHRPVLKLRRLKSQQDACESAAMPLEPEEPAASPAQRQARIAEHPWLGREDLDQAGFEDTVPSVRGELTEFENSAQALEASQASGMSETSEASEASEALETSQALEALGKKPAATKRAAPNNAAPVEAKSCSESEAEAILLGLKVGRWVDLYSRRRWLRAQLIWASSHGTLFMFVSHGGQAHSMTKRSGERLIRQNLLRPVESHSVVAQALNQVARETGTVQP